LAAALWVGGMGFFALVVVPVVLRNLESEQARAVLRKAGERFAKVGWVSLGVLIVTGVGNLAFRGLLPALGTAMFWRTPFGSTLALKLVTVALVLVMAVLHARESRRGAVSRARASMLGRVVLMLSVAAIVLAVFLVRGAPW
jgi:putative copper export protein